MPRLSLSWLGPPKILLDGEPLTTFKTQKVLALLAFLAVEAARPHRREELCGLFWPDQTDVAARDNLRVTLYRLRQTLHADAHAPFVEATRDTAQFNPGSDHWLDLADFNTLMMACRDHAHERMETCAECSLRLTKAVDLYRGDFLQGMSLADSAAFEEWVLVQREALRRQVLSASETLSAYHEQRGDYEALGREAHRQLALEPWHEPAHRQLMRGLALAGDRNAALAQYEACRRVLTQELGIEPEVETNALYEHIRSGNFRLPQPAQQIENRQSQRDFQSEIANRVDWGEMPTADVFHGRAAEMAQLQHWLLQAQCRSVSILGIGGVGKTTLAAAVTQAVATAFDGVIWRSLLNAPPLDEIVHNWLQLLSPHALSQSPKTLDERLRLLLDCLRQQRFLLVLDNVESILQPSVANQERAGEMRPGYEDYATLFRYLATSDHRSCLLLTSREQPYALAQIGREIRTVRHLPLGGLDLHAGSAILQGSGLSASSQDTALLVTNYSGNPLALQIVANTIADYFGGDVGAFQREEGFLFDGIRAVLDQQFERLSVLEREILVWLAIEREAVSVQTLRENFVQPVAPAALLSALNALQARSLLELVGDGLTLQNVVIEYVTDYLIGQVCREIEDERWSVAVDIAGEGDVQSTLLVRHALLKSQAKEYVRHSQARMILQPIAQRLIAHLGQKKLETKLQRILAGLRSVRRAGQVTGYAAGNLLNLLLHLEIDLRGYDFSELTVWQVYLQGCTVPEINFAYADFVQAVFTDVFSPIVSVAISPDDRILAAGTTTGEIRLWQLADKQLCGSFHGHTDTVRSLAFSPDGRLCASASSDHTVRVWDVHTDRCQSLFTEHHSEVFAVAFSPDGNILASAGQDCNICLWDIAQGRLCATLSGHSQPIRALAFNPQAHAPMQLLSASADHTLRLWEIAVPDEGGRLLSTFQGHTDQIRAAVFSPDGTMVASGGAGGSIRLWNASTGQQLQVMHGHKAWVRSLAFSPDNTLLASGGAEKTLRLWEIPSGRDLAVLHGHSSTIWGVAITARGDTLISGAEDISIRFWDLRQAGRGRILGTILAHTAGINAITFSPDGATLVSGDRQNKLRLWRLATGEVEQVLSGHTDSVNTVAFSPDGKFLVSGGQEGRLCLWDGIRPERPEVLHIDANPLRVVAFSPDGTLLASAGYSGTIQLWQLQGQALGLLHMTLKGDSIAVLALAFSPAGDLLAGAGLDGVVNLWEIATGRTVCSLKSSSPTITALAFHPHDQTLAIGGSDGAIQLWDLHTPERGRILHTLHSHTYLETLAFHPAGHLLASGGNDRMIYLWDVQRGNGLGVMAGHTQYVTSIAFHPNGELLASSSYDETIRLWDLASRRCLRMLRAPGPYAGMNITGATGISAAQKAALKVLGAVES